MLLVWVMRRDSTIWRHRHAWATCKPWGKGSWRAAWNLLRNSSRGIHGRNDGGRSATVEEELGWNLLDLRDNIVLLRLRGKHTFSIITMPLAFAVLLVGVLYADILVHEILAVHVGDSVVRSLESRVGHKSVAF
jgi:hypothetical protein